MSEPSSSPDDTSVASSGDELLNSAPLFSEDSAKTSRGKRENTEIDCEPSSSSDDTSVASSGDELLNVAPLFSQDSAKSRGKRENTEIDGGEPTDSLRTKRKLDDITDGFGADDKGAPCFAPHSRLPRPH